MKKRNTPIIDLELIGTKTDYTGCLKKKYGVTKWCNINNSIFCNMIKISSGC